jgi:hypothetical protein
MDLHWVDPTTLEWLTLLVDQAPTTRLWPCSRPDRRSRRPGWRARSLTPLTLASFTRKQMGQWWTG